MSATLEWQKALAAEREQNPDRQEHEIVKAVARLQPKLRERFEAEYNADRRPR